MRDTERNLILPAGAYWTRVSGAANSDLLTWIDRAERFEPYTHDAGRETAERFRAELRAGDVVADTYAMCLGDDLLGFYSLREWRIRFVHDKWSLGTLPRRVLHLLRQPGLLLSSIVRSRTTAPGFGHFLFEHALGVALDDPLVRAIFIEPANNSVAEMWRARYSFRPVGDPDLPGTLYFPVNPVN
ncbi:MAG TPA: hypothetical protein VGX72_10975 [Solirubrobacteraceae bacterium]|nr:hypothetical protein [Solirubrobacteraceae bacterium]